MSDFNINEDAQSGGEFSGSQSSFTEAESERLQPTESAFPDEDEDTITMLDVIERENKLEEEASAVLGNSDEKNCTYPLGYIPRQALYSCATCFDDTGKQAAICLACSLECHENHDVYELYTKRNYRCDCGNSRFDPGFECKIIDKQLKKAPLNESNKYNHNFSGRYCKCDKRYPPDENDDSADSQDDMFQCIACEDWYHTKHLGVQDIPPKFEELICGECVEELDFVHYYRYCEEVKSSPEENGSQTDLVQNQAAPEVNESSEINGNPMKESDHKATEPDKNTESTGAADSDLISVVTSAPESDTNDSQSENKDPVKIAQQAEVTSIDNNCILEQMIKSVSSDKVNKEPIFWLDCSWRSKLCKCRKCMDMYEAKKCLYLLDEEDSVQFYEAQGRTKAKDRQTPLERGMSALNRMNRVAVAEALHGYNELKADLSTYLRKFADNNKVVREEDIHEFFNQLQSKKRPKTDY